MTTQAVEAPQVSDAMTDASPWQRLLALSGVAFAPLFVVGWLSSAVSDSPNYIAGNRSGSSGRIMEDGRNWSEPHLAVRQDPFAQVRARARSRE